VVADLSVGADGYWADTCRTYVNGDSERVTESLVRLDEIMAAAARQLRAGQTGASVYQVVKDGISAAWPDGEFPHHAGHGVGLTVFDDPHLIPAGDQVLENWMVQAIEPGVYGPGGIGVRRENLFLVTPDGGVDLAEAMAGPMSEQAHAAWSRL
jgi:Xaa-Pro aminopeptidase